MRETVDTRHAFEKTILRKSKKALLGKYRFLSYQQQTSHRTTDKTGTESMFAFVIIDTRLKQL